MTQSVPDPRATLRDLTLALAAVLPYARQGGGASFEVAQQLATAQRLLADARHLDALPWSAVLDVSMIHLSPAERDALHAGHTPDPFALSMHNDHACVLFRPATAPTTVTALGPGLSAIAVRAAENGFRYVRLDEDGPPVPGLEVYP